MQPTECVFHELLLYTGKQKGTLQTAWPPPPDVTAETATNSDSIVEWEDSYNTERLHLSCNVSQVPTRAHSTRAHPT